MIRILTTLFNAEKYIANCLDSIISQEEKDWVCYVTDDMSTDSSAETVKEFCEKDSRIKLIRNREKKYQLGNYAQVMELDEIDDEDIVITVDGDDCLPDPKVFTRVKEAYSDGNTWVTYGQFVQWHGEKNLSMGFSSPPEDFSKLREARQTISHLRTFRAFLWRRIKPEDFLDDNGETIQCAGDIAFMFPMLEMAGEKRSKFLSDINYVYNLDTDLNVHKKELGKQLDMAVLIRSKEPYREL